MKREGKRKGEKEFFRVRSCARNGGVEKRENWKEGREERNREKRFEDLLVHL